MRARMITRYRKVICEDKRIKSRMNQPVLITNITLQAKQNRFGEFNKSILNQSSHAKDYPRLERLRDYIALLASITNMNHIHRNYYYNNDKRYVLESQNNNHITQLVLHEFSLYTAEQPLTENEFKQLIGEIEKISVTVVENVYLILASFAVADENKRVRNHVIYVQCGQHPKINILTKINPWKKDPCYDGYNHYHYNGTIYRDSKPAWIMLNQTGNNNIGYNEVVHCETIGGAKFLSVIDICLDHQNEEGKKQLDETIQNTNKNIYLPENVSHLLISNSIHEEQEAIVLANPNRLIHVDPQKLATLRRDQLFILERLEKENFLQQFMAKYKSLKVEVHANKVAIINSPFGKNIDMFFSKAMQLCQPKKEILHNIRKHNYEVLCNKLSAYCNDFNPVKLYKRNPSIIIKFLLWHFKTLAKDNIVAFGFIKEIQKLTTCNQNFENHLRRVIDNYLNCLKHDEKDYQRFKEHLLKLKDYLFIKNSRHQSISSHYFFTSQSTRMKCTTNNEINVASTDNLFKIC